MKQICLSFVKTYQFFIIILALNILSCGPRLQKDELHDSLSQSISEIDSVHAFNGVVGVLRKDKDPLIFFHGYKSPIEHISPLDSSDYFYLASNSKTFAGYATLKMLGEFGLQANDTIGPYFDELHPNLGRITIQQLANHTCAIHDYLSLTDKDAGITNEEAMELIANLDSTVYEAGAQWGYTNSGYVLLSILIERVSGMSYNDYLLKEILLPLGITNAQMHPNEISSLQGYQDNKPAEVISVTTGDAGIYFNTNDLLQFFENQHKLNEYVQQAYQWSSPWHDDKWRYGFGWFFSEDSLGKFRAHAGKSSGFESYFRVYDSNELMIFILSNHVNGSAKPMREAVVELINQYAHQKPKE